MDKDKSSLRRRDFSTGILLILLALGIIWEASGYPMSDSYGGVQNVWYVSPALFPLMVGVLLLILALVLVGNAIAFHGWPAILKTRGRASGIGERDYRFLAIVLFFCAFVYVYIPQVDFFIASALFLFSFIGAYYLAQPPVLMVNTIIYCVTAGAVLLAAGEGSGQAPQWIPDGLTAAGLVVLYLTSGRICKGGADCRRRLRITLAVSILVPLILCPAFRFGLLVPLPTEGIFMAWMEGAKYALRALF